MQVVHWGAENEGRRPEEIFKFRFSVVLAEF